MMVVDKGDRSDDTGFRRLNGSAHQPVANQIAKCFRSVRVALLRYKTVKASEKIGIDSNARPG